jgi:hypothetical protein
MSLWSRASALAAKTPPTRNRYVDFLRAVSIGAVVFGHWLAAAPYVDERGELTPTHMLAVSHWTQGLTWVIQVMPVFFIVGGYANGISWRAARAAQRSYAQWLDGRVRRLIGPVLVLVAAWALLAVFARAIGLPEPMARIGSQMALIPIWFLAVYLLVALLVPITHAAWERFGMASFVAPALAAVLLDVAFFAAGMRGLPWLNYLFVWSAVHQLGYAWRDGHFDRPWVALAWAAGGSVALVALIGPGPYPLSMVGVPGDAISNTTPPKVTLIALACLQGGLLLALQAPLRRWLDRSAPWTATVLVNGLIMTVYLWHMTALVLFLGLVHALGDPGLGIHPGTGLWWGTRPVWLSSLALALLPFALVFSRFERPKDTGGPPPAGWRQICGALLVCAGLAQLAKDGIAVPDGIGVRVEWVAAIFAGAALAGYWRRGTTKAKTEVAAEAVGGP